MEHQTGEGDEMQGGGRVGPPFVVAGKPPKARDPSLLAEQKTLRQSDLGPDVLPAELVSPPCSDMPLMRSTFQQEA